jgi:hypothetical protein
MRDVRPATPAQNRTISARTHALPTQLRHRSYSAFGACYASVASPAWSPAVVGYLSQREGEHTAPLALPRRSWRPRNLAEMRVLGPQNPHTSGSAEWFPTESPRTKRHSPAHDGTDANMPLPPLTGLYAGSAGLTILKLPVVRAATGLLLSGRSRVRVAVGAQVIHPGQRQSRQTG